ncbi:MAG: hypothetical protein WC101_05060 [Candidatus Gracilibacteria bacterium]
MTPQPNSREAASDSDILQTPKVATKPRGRSVKNVLMLTSGSVSDLLNQSQAKGHLSLDFFRQLSIQTDAVLRDIAVLLETATLDPMDRLMIGQVTDLIKHPTNVLSDIEAETVRIANVCAGYMMQGEDVPPAIDAISDYLFALQCVNRISFVEEAIERKDFYDPEVFEAWNRAFEWAIYSENDALVRAVDDLKISLNNAKLGERLENL